MYVFVLNQKKVISTALDFFFSGPCESLTRWTSCLSQSYRERKKKKKNTFWKSRCRCGAAGRVAAAATHTRTEHRPKSLGRSRKSRERKLLSPLPGFVIGNAVLFNRGRPLLRRPWKSLCFSVSVTSTHSLARSLTSSSELHEKELRCAAILQRNS